tara:strand:+ start:333 stop:1277 length:945 start_codon:yes stop_codon:yes gene_type:complete
MKYDNNTETINHLSLCSGYEGIGLGLRRIFPNLREIAYVEREGFPIANLVAKMEAGKLDSAPVFTDVKTFPYGKFRGLVDILSGGFPCQPFSSAGKRDGVEDPRHLFPFIAEGIRQCRPKIVFLENVEGIISAKTNDGESVLQYVIRTLEDLDYRATAGIFSASEVGASHQRKRVFILGYAGSSKPSRLPNEQREKVLEVGKSGKTLADPMRSGLERVRECNSKKRRQNPSRQYRGDCEVWPSKPGETQQEWEEPRVSRDDNHNNKTQTNREAKSSLGRANYGHSSRVDRLRLLGNGVVPATAAKAFVTLANRF